MEIDANESLKAEAQLKKAKQKVRLHNKLNENWSSCEEDKLDCDDVSRIIFSKLGYY